MLDKNQQEIVGLTDGMYKVVATAGAGKSTVLLCRSAELYRRTRSVLCVTFTNEAAKSLRVRCGKQFAHVDTSIFSTLHALALKFAYDYGYAYPFKLADNLLADEQISAGAVYQSIGDKLNFKNFTNWVSLQKRNCISSDEAIKIAVKSNQKVDFAIGYKRYQQNLQQKGMLDFDDLLYYMVTILRQRPDIRNQLQYEYLMVDESQDCCELDWRLVSLLSQKHQNLMAVGDPGQQIFSFRGAASDFFLKMEDHFPDTQTYYLGTNYRSTPEIVQFGKEAYPYPDISTRFHAARSSGPIPAIKGYSTPETEAEGVVDEIKRFTPESCAVLARTNLALRAFEERMLEEGVQYHILGDSGFWELPEVRNLLYYVRLCVGPTDHSVLGAIRSPYWPTKYVKKKIVCEKIQEKIRLTGKSAWSILDTIPELRQFKDAVIRLFYYQYLPAGEALRDLIKTLKLKELYSGEENLNPYSNPLDNVAEVVRAANRYDSLKDFLKFVTKIQGYNKQKKGVTLSTVHQAKGLQFDNVFFVQCNRDILPHCKSEDLESERCIWFVGVSRAAETLNISFSGCPSIFLKTYLEVKNEQDVYEV